MKYLTLTLAAILLSGILAFAQDPGIPDSVIIQQVHVDSTASFALVPVTMVTDDSVGFYNLPLAWHAPYGGVYPGPGTMYFPSLTPWDLTYDTVVTSENYLRMFGLYTLGSDSVPPLITNGQRRNVMNLRFIINPGTRSQLVVIDSAIDLRGGPIRFGLIDGVTEFAPTFVRGFISIGSVGITDNPIVPREIELSQNYPNPFNPSTEIGFSLPQRSEVRLVIYNLLGQEVRELLDQTFEQGRHSVIWDGRDNSGGNIPSGAYFYRLTALGFSDSKIMTLIR
jgi:hypothetical protein